MEPTESERRPVLLRLSAVCLAAAIMGALGVCDILFRSHLLDVGIGILLGAAGTLGLAVAIGFRDPDFRRVFSSRNRRRNIPPDA